MSSKDISFNRPILNQSGPEEKESAPSKQLIHSAQAPDYEPAISICVDFSNIRLQTDNYKCPLSQSKQIDVGAFVKKVEGDRKVYYRGVAGSSSNIKDCKFIDSLWKSFGYETYFQLRTFKKERFVDEAVKNMIFGTILRSRHMVNLKIVLVTGDGNTSPYGLMSFPEMVEITICKYGRDVEVWSNSDNLHDEFLKLKRKYPTKLTIVYIDRWETELYKN